MRPTVKINNKMKNYGSDTELWYYGKQGEEYELNLETRKGFLVYRPEIENSRLHLIPHRHAELVEPSDDDMV